MQDPGDSEMRTAFKFQFETSTRDGLMNSAQAHQRRFKQESDGSRCF